MDNEQAIAQRLAMILDGEAPQEILICGHYMPGVREAFNEVRRLLDRRKLARVRNSGNSLQILMRNGARLQAMTIQSIRGRRPDVLLIVGEINSNDQNLIGPLKTQTTITYHTLGV